MRVATRPDGSLMRTPAGHLKRFGFDPIRWFKARKIPEAERCQECRGRGRYLILDGRRPGCVRCTGVHDEDCSHCLGYGRVLVDQRPASEGVYR